MSSDILRLVLGSVLIVGLTSTFRTLANNLHTWTVGLPLYLPLLENYSVWTPVKLGRSPRGKEKLRSLLAEDRQSCTTLQCLTRQHGVKGDWSLTGETVSTLVLSNIKWGKILAGNVHRSVKCLVGRDRLRCILVPADPCWWDNVRNAWHPTGLF